MFSKLNNYSLKKSWIHEFENLVLSDGGQVFLFSVHFLSAPTFIIVLPPRLWKVQIILRIMEFFII